MRYFRRVMWLWASVLALFSCATAPRAVDVVVSGLTPKGLAPELSRRDAVALANKWSMDLIGRQTYRLYIPFKLAVLADPYLHETYERLGLAALSPGEFVRAVSTYAAKEMVHLQHIDAFRDRRSRMPWGTVGLSNEVYRRLLPSEMAAMSQYAGKTSGACECLTLFLTGLFRLKGVPPEDVVHLRLADHTIALVRYEGTIFGINNTAVGAMTPTIQSWHTKQAFKGLFGETFALYRSFRMRQEAFTAPGSLIDAIAATSGLAVSKGPDVLAAVDLTDQRALRNALFEDLARTEPALAQSVAFASQRRDAGDLGVYLEASLAGPLARTLARSLGSPEAVASWIREHIRTGSIYADGDERLLVADQVLVYKTGTSWDKAVLAYTLLAHAGQKPRLAVDGEKASVVVQGLELTF